MLIRLLLRVFTAVTYYAYVLLVVQLGPPLGRLAERCGQSNCFVWAIYQQYRYGGYVVMGDSAFVAHRHHFGWSPDLATVLEYDPPTKRQCARPPLLFAGSPQPWKPLVVKVREVPVEDYAEVGI